MLLKHIEIVNGFIRQAITCAIQPAHIQAETGKMHCLLENRRGASPHSSGFLLGKWRCAESLQTRSLKKFGDEKPVEKVSPG